MRTTRTEKALKYNESMLIKNPSGEEFRNYNFTA